MHETTRTVWGSLVAFLFLVILYSAPAPADGKQTDSISLSLGGGTLPPGGVLALPLSLVPGGNDVDTLVVFIGLDAMHLTLSGAESGEGAGGKQLEYQQTDTEIALVFFGGDGPLQAGILAMLYFEAPPDTSFSDVMLTAGMSSASDSDANALTVSLSIAPVSIAALGDPHDGDSNANGRIGLPELLRVVQLYNAERIGCDEGAEDGFAPGSVDESCAPHDLDYQTQDWRIELGELLRCIQFYNSFQGSYHLDGAGEDGFAAGLGR